MHARVVLGVGKGVLFREVSSIQGSGIEGLCCIALSVLLFSCSDSEKNYLYQLDIVGDVTAILDIFKFDPGVISEAFGVIACLSSLAVFVQAIGREGVHRQVWSIATQHTHVCAHSYTHTDIEGDETL